MKLPGVLGRPRGQHRLVSNTILGHDRQPLAPSGSGFERLHRRQAVRRYGEGSKEVLSTAPSETSAVR